MAGSLASNTLEGKWVSTVDLVGLPYTIARGANYETVVFGDTEKDFGKVLHTERADTSEQAINNHDRIVMELTMGLFEPNGENWQSIASK